MDALTRDLEHIDYPMPTIRDAPQPTAPRIFPPHLTAPSARASRGPELARQMSTHQLQQGYADSSAASSVGSNSRSRAHVEYPTLATRREEAPSPQSQESPHIGRSFSIGSVPTMSRPPRPPKVRADQAQSALVSIPELGRGVFASSLYVVAGS